MRSYPKTGKIIAPQTISSGGSKTTTWINLQTPPTNNIMSYGNLCAAPMFYVWDAEPQFVSTSISTNFSCWVEGLTGGGYTFKTASYDATNTITVSEDIVTLSALDTSTYSITSDYYGKYRPVGNQAFQLGEWFTVATVNGLDDAIALENGKYISDSNMEDFARWGSTNTEYVFGFCDSISGTATFPFPISEIIAYNIPGDTVTVPNICVEPPPLSHIHKRAMVVYHKPGANGTLVFLYRDGSGDYYTGEVACTSTAPTYTGSGGSATVSGPSFADWRYVFEVGTRAAVEYSGGSPFKYSRWWTFYDPGGTARWLFMGSGLY